MNKPLILSLAAAALLSTNLNAQSMYEKFEAMELEMNKMKKELQMLKAQAKAPVSAVAEEEDDKEEIASKDDDDDKDSDEEAMNVEEEIISLQESVSDLNKNTSGSHLKFGVDYRFALENMKYTMADGSTQDNEAFMTNRFWMNMDWSATDNLSFTAQLAYNKAFGARSGANAMTAPYDTFDWIANENAYDDTLRVRSVYFLYRNDTFFEADVPWTFSIGRRPSTNGHLINLRDDDKAASPMGHSINVEFDGLSSKFGLENLTGVDGMYVKLCAGRGMSNAAPKFASTPYTNVDSDQGANPDIDLIGLIFAPYSDGQYSFNTQYYYANNLIDMANPMDPSAGFDTVGGLHSFTANVVVNGIGNSLSDYLDDSTFFLSGAMSKTAPESDQSMLTTELGESKTGYSYWVGLQMPSVITDDGRWGLEFNHGSQYWRSITYGEDTNIGSKIAARGNAYEAYFTEYLVDDILSMQIRYTYIDYDYTGSNGFFGGTSGLSEAISDNMLYHTAEDTVDKAQDIRFYLRYKY
ncbi:MAG: DUF3373 domain-containing protein [Sulfurimonas sp.]|nr:DUF3373 domain-containing protein [Sulfurimonas sp.]MBU3940142.1 DUF3373 domain-containing protein [bacterium]MBU4023559.1 DUF3373 domain-containing protein [bacterium]MBU4058933.1 DUF3373 domain-containing protein [bacterium]MBU4110946.1 DUF3373 domain-containing protein [bacterium]